MQEAPDSWVGGSLLTVKHEKAEPQRVDLGHFFIAV